MKPESLGTRNRRAPGPRSMRWILGAAACALLVLNLPSVARASPIGTVAKGWDLFMTLDGTTFGGIPFMGVPLGCYDFGSGCVDTHATDTIVRRLEDAHAPSEAIDIQMVALQLVSKAAVDLGAGLGLYYITLNPAHSSLGTMTIFFDPQFVSIIDVHFDLHFGSLDGPIVIMNGSDQIAGGANWSDQQNNSLVIPGVNGGFFPEPFDEQGLLAKHRVMPTAVPEPSTVLLAGIGGALARLARRKSRK